MSRQQDRILFTILTKVALLLVPPYCSTVIFIKSCSVSIAVISRPSIIRATCSYPAKRSMKELITYTANLLLNCTTLRGKLVSLIVSLLCFITQDIRRYLLSFFFFIKNTGSRYGPLEGSRTLDLLIFVTSLSNSIRQALVTHIGLS